MVALHSHRRRKYNASRFVFRKFSSLLSLVAFCNSLLLLGRPGLCGGLKAGVL
jgi:hypothetical protein